MSKNPENRVPFLLENNLTSKFLKWSHTRWSYRKVLYTYFLLNNKADNTFLNLVYTASTVRRSHNRLNYIVQYSTPVWYCVVWETLTSRFSRKKLDVNFSLITWSHMVVLRGIRWLLDITYTISLNFNVSQRFEMLYTTSSITIFNTVRSYNIPIFKKHWRPTFLEDNWTSIFLKLIIGIWSYHEVFNGCRILNYSISPNVNISLTLCTSGQNPCTTVLATIYDTVRPYLILWF